MSRTSAILCSIIALCTMWHLDARASTALHHWETKAMKVKGFPVPDKNALMSIPTMSNVNGHDIFVLSTYSLTSGAQGNQMLYESVDSGKTLTQFSTAIFPDTMNKNCFYLREDGVGCIVGFQRRFRAPDIARNWNMTLDTSIEYAYYTDRCKNTIITNSANVDVTVSEDFGETWQQRKFPDSIRNNNLIMRAVLVDSATLFLTRTDMNRYTGSYHGKYYLSSDLGSTWESLGCTVDGFEKDTAADCDLAPTFLDNGRIGLGLLTHFDSTKHMLYSIVRSSDHGRHWSILRTEPADQEIRAPSQFLHMGHDSIMMVYASGIMQLSTDAGLSWDWFVKTIPLYTDKSGRRIALSSMSAVHFYSMHSAVATFDRRQDSLFNIMYLADGETATAVQDDAAQNPVVSQQAIRIVSCSPQPVEEYAHLRVCMANTIDLSSLRTEIVDLRGERIAAITAGELRVKARSETENSCDVDVSLRALPSGTYLVKICSAQGECAVMRVCHVGW